MEKKGPREKYLEVLGQPANLSMCKHYSQARKKIILNASPTKQLNMYSQLIL